jgi:ubiquinone/menaquinone biosynthesis C-methylase UbiE
MSNPSKHDQIKDYYKEDGLTYLERRWQDTPVARFDYKMTREALLGVLKGKKYEKILEIGPGPGTWTPIFAGICESLTLVDISDTMLDIAKNRLKEHEITFHLGDFMELRFEEKFDLIIAVRSFEYFEEKEKFIHKCNNILSDGGEIILVTKTKGSIWYGKSKIRDLLWEISPELFKYEQTNARGGKAQIFWQERMFVRQTKSILKMVGFFYFTVRPVIIRPPIFMRGKMEIPLVPPKLEGIFLSIFSSLTKLVKNISFFTVFSESYLIYGRKNK